MECFWSKSAEGLFISLNTDSSGLSTPEAFMRAKAERGRSYRHPEWVRGVVLFFSQFKSPLMWILLIAVSLSFSLGENVNAFIISAIIVLSAALSFWQEYKADRAVKKLRAMIRNMASVRRDGSWQKVPTEQVVPGDIIRLSAGDMVPADCLLLQLKDLHLNEAPLSGESFPVEKKLGTTPADAPLNRRTNAVFLGSSVVNGEAEALVVKTGDKTEFGSLAKRLQEKEDTTAFESGVHNFGLLLLRLAFALAAGIFALNLMTGKPLVDSLLFAVALAVGLAPELLPAIMVTALSAGAARMAREKVIVKRLAAIQNLGAITILCSDKTGTLTTGAVEVHETVDHLGRHSERLRRFAWLNAYFETGFSNPLDEALRRLENMSATEFSKFDEVPYDFIRKRLSVVVEHNGRHLMITKGALRNVLDVCSRVENADGVSMSMAEARPAMEELFQRRSSEGFRTIGVAWKDITGDPVIDKDDEHEMIFMGFIFLFDPPKPQINTTLDELGELSVRIKVITGDNRLIARHTAGLLGANRENMLSGPDLDRLDDAALCAKALETDVFAEIDPHQKERIIRALRRSGEVVGYLGDGINDAGALRAADVGISVDNAVDVAKEASDLILMEKNLNVLCAGISEGRKTFLNILKYIFITTSANFGNMFSLAGISTMIPFLPMMPHQILLLNFLSDIPALGIAGDRVDPEMIRKPKRWNVVLIRRFMTVFGLQSAVFDFLTFGVLLLGFHVGESHFQTGWFVESALTELAVLLIIRTTRPVFKSRPSAFLILASFLVASVVLIIPYLPFSAAIGFKPLPLPLLGCLILICILYGWVAEYSKNLFFRKFQL